MHDTHVKYLSYISYVDGLAGVKTTVFVAMTNANTIGGIKLFSYD